MTPSRSGYAFDPVSSAVTVDGANVTGQDFTAIEAASTYTLSGSVSGATGVKITLSGTASGTTTTSGAFSFAGLPPGTYTVQPEKAGYAFSPETRTADVTDADVTIDPFTATPTTFSVSGTVSGASGVQLTLTPAGGGAPRNVTAGAGGLYTFADVAPGDYTVTPAMADYTFEPASAPVTVAAANVGGVNFETLFSIAGAVTGSVTSGVTVTLSGSGADVVTTTAAGGGYGFTGIPAGNYTVTPTHAGHQFDPASQSVTLDATNLSGVSFAATAATVPTYTISGTISGPYVDGITVRLRLGGVPVSTATTGAAGTYSFPGLAAGSYTVTAELSGYQFSPTPGAVTISGANVTQDFVQASKVAAYGVSGNVLYAGTQAGRIYLWALPSGCVRLECASNGTSVVKAGASTPYTIRGLAAGTYTLVAGIDNVGHGERNVTNAFGVAGPFSILGVDVTGRDVTLSDPAPVTPQAPSEVGAFPTSGNALVFWEAPWDDSSEAEAATSYRVSWGTDADASNGGTAIVPARDDSHYIVTGLPNGSAYRFKVSTRIGSSESTATVSDPVVIGPLTGGNTVSGTITRPAAITGALLVVVTDDDAVFAWTRVENLAVTQSYSITGVPSGRYAVFAAIDVNANGYIDIGDLTGEMGLTVAGNASGVNLALAQVGQTATLRTQHFRHHDHSWEGYHVIFDIEGQAKLPVAVTVLSGPNVRLPLDLPRNWGFESWQNTSGIRPLPGDAYKLRTVYSDGSTETYTLTVGTVLDAFPRNLAAQSSETPGVPLFTWQAPLTAPASYTYRVGVFGSANWWYPDEAGLPSTTTSVLYNVDGRASSATLGAGATWYVEVEDQDGNIAQLQKNYP